MNYTTEIAGYSFPGVLALVMIGLWVLLHIVLAVAIVLDVDRLRQRRREPQLLGKGAWWFFTVLSGPVGFAFYWVMHHSNLRDGASDLPLGAHDEPQPAGMRAS
jgi:hypothetical protein